MLRKFAKWWFDLLKNAILLVAIKVIANKSGNLYIYSVSILSNVLFSMYITSYFNGWSYYPLGVNNQRKNASILTVIFVVIFLFTSMLLSVVSLNFIETLVKLQIK